MRNKEGKKCRHEERRDEMRREESQIGSGEQSRGVKKKMRRGD